MSDPREEAAFLADEILANIELADISLSSVMLKCARLGRLLGDERKRLIFAYEAGGYPNSPNGVERSVFELGREAGRTYTEKSKEGELVERMNCQSVEVLESSIEAKRTTLTAAVDPNVSISSANPNQYVMKPFGNQKERENIGIAIRGLAEKIARSRAFAYEYASSVHYELAFSKVASSIFGRASERIDLFLLEHAPSASSKTASINENLQSDNPEDWANAVHGCRRLLQDVADTIFPAQEPRTSNGKTIKLGPDNYINRLIAFIEDASQSGRFIEIVGSTLAYLGERIDAVFGAAQKGSHASISSREEAERYVIYTYMTVGDILALKSA